MFHFVGDPRYSVDLRIATKEFEALKENKELHTNLLDYLLRAALCDEKEIVHHSDFFLGSLSSFNTFKTATEYNDTHHFGIRSTDRMMKKMKPFQKGNQQIVIPHLSNNHFFVLVLMTNASAGIKSIQCYDSLKRKKSMKGKNMELPLLLKKIVLHVHRFWCKYVFDDEKKLEEVYETVQFIATPQQKNGIDCGLFAVGVCLHLLHGYDVSSNTFSQNDITLLRVNMSHELNSWVSTHSICEKVYNNPFLHMTSDVILKHFPLLRGTEIHDNDIPTDDEKLFEAVLQPSQVEDISCQKGNIDKNSASIKTVEIDVDIPTTNDQKLHTKVNQESAVKEMNATTTKKENNDRDGKTLQSQEISVDIASTKEIVTNDKKLHTTTTTRESTLTNVRIKSIATSFPDNHILQLLVNKHEFTNFNDVDEFIDNYEKNQGMV